MPCVSLSVAAGTAALGAGTKALSASDAASAETNAANQAAQTQRQMYNQTRADLAPYRDFGAGVIGPLTNLLTGNPAAQEAQLASLPGYQFALKQGLQATQDSAAARGLGTSGAALQGAANYATGLADSTYGSQVNRLMSAAGLGEGASAQTGNFGAQAAGEISRDQLAAGQAQAAADMAIGNAIASPFSPQSLQSEMKFAGMLSQVFGDGSLYVGG